MPAKKFLRLAGGAIAEAIGVQTSAGAGNAGDIPALDDTGRLDGSMMPVGIGADTQTIAASEAIAAGAFVNVYNSSGVKCRNADATATGKDADGFVLAAVASGANATVYFRGSNTQVTGQTVGPVYLQTTAGAAGATVPSATGNVVQRLGVATSATSIAFSRGQSIALA